MDFSKIKKGLFTTKEPDKTTAAPTKEKDKITYRDYGFTQASALRGNLPGLKVCLQKLYYNFRQDVQQDFDKQEELKKPYRIKIEEYKGNNVSLRQKIDKAIAEDIPKAKKKIETLKEELSYIRKNPHEIIGDDAAGKAGFYIGLTILAFLTIYLFVFYSSATYSAFFKEFTLNEIGLASSIFDPKAFTIAWRDGFTELLLLLTIPFVFLGLGYLIHKFQEQKDMKKYGKIALLILVTFVFDAILAYEITEKIYNIKKENSFENVPDYSFKLAFQSISFWLIIFAGFIVYLIWGFVFDFVMEAYAKLDKVNVALKEKQKEIKDAEQALKDTEVLVDKMNHTIAENEKEINKLYKVLEGTIVPRDFEQDIYQFMGGWLAWMEQANKPHDEITASSAAVEEFLKVSFVNVEA